jgi:hypothetical protein
MCFSESGIVQVAFYAIPLIIILTFFVSTRTNKRLFNAIFDYNVQLFIVGAFIPIVNIVGSIILLFNYFAYRVVR